MRQLFSLFGGSIFVFALSLFYAFTNGLRNAPLIVATVVSTRAISPGRAFLLCAICEFLGTVFLGSAVVFTISQQMFGALFHRAASQQVLMVLGSVISAVILWGSLCYLRAIPTSNSHALFAGFTGASWAAWGPTHLLNSAMIKGFFILILTPIGALLVAALVTYLLRWAGEWMTPKVVPLADHLHILSSMLVAGSYGSNDGQMAITVAILSWGLVEGIASSDPAAALLVPLWIKITVACCMALGVLTGGRRIIKKLGMSFYRLEILQGVGAQLAAAGIILGCVEIGFPASTSQVITGSILGAGVAKDPRDVRWASASDIVLSWFVTFPVVGLMSGLTYKILQWVGRP